MRTPGVSETEPQVSAPANERWLLLAIGLGTTLAPLNSTMIAVALPSIQDDLHVSVSQTAWLVTLYLVAMAVGQPIGGRIGDLFGRRRVYLLGLLWFGVASAACALAPNLALLVVFRTMQALAGALTFPNGAAMVRQAVPPERRGSAFGLVGMLTALAAAIGPPLGGLLVHAFSWHAIFWVNVPIILVAFLANMHLLPADSPRQTRAPFDWLGSALFGATLTTFIAIPTLVRVDRIPLALAMGVVALVLAVVFVRLERGRAHPVVDVGLFGVRSFAAACSSIALSNFVMYTTLLALPVFLDHVRGENDQTIGLTLAAMSALAAIWGLLGGRISDRRGRWLPAVAGAIGLLIGISLLTGVLERAPLWPIVLSLAIMGIGLGVQGAPVQTVAVESAPMEKTGSAAGVYSTSRYLGSVIGATILALVFSSDAATNDASRFQLLFAGLALAAVAGIVVNNRVAPRHAPEWSTNSVAPSSVSHRSS